MKIKFTIQQCCGIKIYHVLKKNCDLFPEIPHSQSSPVLGASTSTKVLYFTDRSLTPFLVNIPKRYQKQFKFP